MKDTDVTLVVNRPYEPPYLTTHRVRTPSWFRLWLRWRSRRPHPGQYSGGAGQFGFNRDYTIWLANKPKRVRRGP